MKMPHTGHNLAKKYTYFFKSPKTKFWHDFNLSSLVVQVVEFLSGGYKIRKSFA